MDALQGAVAELIALQRAALDAQRPAPAEVPGEQGSSPAIAPLLGQLDALRDRVRRHREEAGRHVGHRAAPPRFAEIEVERVNVIEADGTPRLAISNRERAPAPLLNGKPLGDGEREGGNSAGIIFYNDEGDECGGLSFGGKGQAGHYAAGAGLFFDQLKQDQTIGIVYDDTDGRRWAGLCVWDRPDLPLDEHATRYFAAQRLPEGAARDAAFAQMKAEGLVPAQRIFVGKRQDGAAALNLLDAQGRVRLRLAVDAAGAPALEFLDAEGRVTHRLPGPAAP